MASLRMVLGPLALLTAACSFSDPEGDASSVSAGGSVSTSTTSAGVRSSAAGSSSPASSTGGATGLQVDAGSYVTSGAIHGYAWTTTSGAGTTLTPTDFGSHAAGSPLCVSGTVSASATVEQGAWLGLNVNQASAAASPLLTYTPTGSGLSYEVTNGWGPP